MLEIPVSLSALGFLSIVVGKVSLEIRACLVSQFIIVSLVSIASLGTLVILVILSLLASVVPLAIRAILVSFLPILLFYRISPNSLGWMICRIDRVDGVS